MWKRKFLSLGFPAMLTVFLIASVALQGFRFYQDPVLRIGLVADPQYADRPAPGNRYYRESLWKLKEALQSFNIHQVDFVQNLGDIIDGEWRSYDSIIPVYLHLAPGIENHHLVGNHDFAVDSSELPHLLEVLSMPDYYYSYTEKGWRFIVLDATDVAFFSNAVHRYPVDQIKSYYDSTDGQPNHYRWNSAIGERQQNWLKQQLDSALVLDQKVIVFSHMPVRPLHERENLWNDHQIIEILESHSVVVAFINGHNHAGGYVMKNGIHYITVHGMVESMANSYGILEVYEDHMVLKGYGNQETLYMEY